VQCDQHPGALSQVKRLDQAAEEHREAIAFVAEVPVDEVDVEVRQLVKRGDAVRLRMNHPWRRLWTWTAARRRLRGTSSQPAAGTQYVR